MKKYIILLISLISLNTYSQELSIQETINYINAKFKGGRKLELTEGGKLKIYELRPDYFFENLRFIEKQKRQKNNNYKMIPLYFEEISIHEIIIENMDFVGNRYAYGDFLIQIKCNSDKKGCSKYKIYGKNREIKNTRNRNIINISNPDRDNNDKLFNALKYLISIAKLDKKYQQNDSDPFSSKNINKTFEVTSEKAKDQIKLNTENGVYKINVEFGSITKSFVLDSGASEISISLNLEKDLISKGLLKKEDYIESGLYKIADGSIISCRKIILKELKVGNFTVKNVVASIGVKESPLLLGKSFLDNFKKWSINNDLQLLILEK